MSGYLHLEDQTQIRKLIEESQIVHTVVPLDLQSWEKILTQYPNHGFYLEYLSRQIANDLPADYISPILAPWQISHFLAPISMYTEFRIHPQEWMPLMRGMLYLTPPFTAKEALGIVIRFMMQHNFHRTSKDVLGRQWGRVLLKT